MMQSIQCITMQQYPMCHPMQDKQHQDKQKQPLLKFSARCTCRNTDLSSANGAAAERDVRITFHILINHCFVLLSHLERLLPTAKPNQCFGACSGPAADLTPFQKFPNTHWLSYKINTQVKERLNAGLYKGHYI